MLQILINPIEVKLVPSKEPHFGVVFDLIDANHTVMGQVGMFRDRWTVTLAVRVGEHHTVTPLLKENNDIRGYFNQLLAPFNMILMEDKGEQNERQP